jgi:hypothetical protein
MRDQPIHNQSTIVWLALSILIIVVGGVVLYYLQPALPLKREGEKSVKQHDMADQLNKPPSPAPTAPRYRPKTKPSPGPLNEPGTPRRSSPQLTLEGSVRSVGNIEYRFTGCFHRNDSLIRCTFDVTNTSNLDTIRFVVHRDESHIYDQSGTFQKAFEVSLGGKTTGPITSNPPSAWGPIGVSADLPPGLTLPLVIDFEGRFADTQLRLSKIRALACNVYAPMLGGADLTLLNVPVR